MIAERQRIGSVSAEESERGLQATEFVTDTDFQLIVAVAAEDRGLLGQAFDGNDFVASIAAEQQRGVRTFHEERLDHVAVVGTVDFQQQLSAGGFVVDRTSTVQTGDAEHLRARDRDVLVGRTGEVENLQSVVAAAFGVDLERAVNVIDVPLIARRHVGHDDRVIATGRVDARRRASQRAADEDVVVDAVGREVDPVREITAVGLRVVDDLSGRIA